MSKYFCPMPFVNIEARTDGHMSICCQMDELIKGPDGKKLNLAENTLSDGWNSEWLDKLRQDFLNGEKPASCYSCWTAEDAGVHSKRQRALKDFPDALKNAQESSELKKPIAMDLKLGNICNNRCRICNSFASSLWVPEEKKRDGDSNRFWDQMRVAGRWPERNPAFWEDFKEISTDLEVLEFYGGEPLLITDHYDILQNLIDTGRSKDITLNYNTNGSIYPDRGVELWPHFKRVMISFSLDGVGSHFEYIRNPAKWDQVRDNLKKLIDQKIPVLFPDICYTVSIFNIYYLDEIIAWRDAEFPNIPIYFNHVYTPEHLSCKVLPKRAKMKVYEKFANSVHPDIISSVKYCTDVDYDNTKMQIFYKHTIFSDQYRNEKFKDTFPEFYKILKEHGNAPEDF
jgi:sulfatase maturation enzyme AslB (radical SAM superfamily)